MMVPPVGHWWPRLSGGRVDHDMVLVLAGTLLLWCIPARDEVKRGIQASFCDYV